MFVRAYLRASTNEQDANRACQALKDFAADHGMKSGDVQYGQCLNYLVWEVDVDSSGNNFSKCFYDIKTRALVGVIYGDGTQDQCNMTSYTIQAGTVQSCTVDVVTGMYEDCKPLPEGGLHPG